MKFKTTLFVWLIIIIVFLITDNVGMNLRNAIRFGGLYEIKGESAEWWRLITYGFLHRNTSHLIGNLISGTMAMLYVENKTNSSTALVVFLFGIVTGGIGFILLNQEMRLIITVGASGGVWSLFSASFIILLSKEKINLIEFLAIFNATMILFYNSTIRIDINNIAHYTAYAGGLIIMTASVVIKHEKVFKRNLELG